MDQAVRDRRHWMGLLARAPEGRVPELLEQSGFAPEVFLLRGPEIGSVMVRGREGGTGSAFNLGEMTVTRCSLKLGCGTVGHGHVQGRRKSDACAAALTDALMQTSRAAEVRVAVIDTLHKEETFRRQERARKAAATKVEFFTMVRGEDVGRSGS